MCRKREEDRDREREVIECAVRRFDEWRAFRDGEKKRVEGVRECSGRRGVPDAVVVCRDGMKERKRRWAGGWVHDDISRGGR